MKTFGKVAMLWFLLCALGSGFAWAGFLGSGYAQPSALLAVKNVAALGFTSDNQVLVTIDKQGSVGRRTLPGGSVEAFNVDIGGVVGTVVFSLGSDFASLSGDTFTWRKAASIWNLTDGALLREFPGFVALALSPDSGLAAAWKRMSYDLTTLDVGTGSIISVLPGESRQEFVQAAISPDGRYVATGHHQGLVKLWDLRSGFPVRELGNLHYKLSVIAFSPDGKRVLAGVNSTSRDQPLLSSWDALTGYFNIGFVAPDSTSAPYSIGFSSDSHWLISGHYQGEVVLWDAFSGDVACELQGFGVSNVGAITHVGLSSDLTYAFARRSDGLAMVWRVTSCLAGYLHRTEVATELRKSKLFAPKGEFETSEQFAARQVQAKSFEAELLDRLGSRLGDELRTQGSAVRQKMTASTKTVALKIGSIGQYNADRQVFPVTIDGLTEIVAVPSSEAQQFKARYPSAKVTGKKRLQNDLSRSELFDVVITNPATGSRYAFGPQEALSREFKLYTPRTAPELRAVVERERSGAQQAARAALRSFETQECTDGEVTVPFNVDAVFVVDPKRECWTPWVLVGGRSFTFKETGNILVQVMYKDGTLSVEMEDGPKESLHINKTVAKIRFKSLRQEAVTVTLTIQ